MATTVLPPPRAATITADSPAAVDEVEFARQVEAIRQLSAKFMGALERPPSHSVNVAEEKTALRPKACESSEKAPGSGTSWLSKRLLLGKSSTRGALPHPATEPLPWVDIVNIDDTESSSAALRSSSPTPSVSSFSSNDDSQDTRGHEQTLVLPAVPLAATTIVPAALTSSQDTVDELLAGQVITVDTDVLVETGGTAQQQAQTRTSLRHYWDNFVAYWCDFRFVLTILDPRDYIFPLTWRKVGYWSLYLSIAAAVALTEHFFGWLGLINPYRWTVAALSILLIIFEPIMLLFMTVFSQPYKHDESWHKLGVTREELYLKNKDVAVIVPCHKSEDVILPTLRGLVAHVREEQIFIIHNGNSKLPIDRTGEVARQQYPKVNYVWSGIGSKNIAQFIGLRLTKKYKYVIVIDDDVILPDNFRMPVHLIKGKTQGVTFPLAANAGPDKDPNWLTRSQDIEYKVAGTVKQFQSYSGSVLYPHGAIAMWKREAFERVLYEAHDCIFYAEDVKCGMGAARLGMHLKHYPGSFVPTEAPVTIFGGSQPNFYLQRIRSWDMGTHIYLNLFVRQFLFSWYRGGDYWWQTITSNVVQKIYEFYALYTLVMDIATIPLLVLGASILQLWKMLGIIFLANTTALVLWRYVALRGRPDAGIRFWDLLVFSLVYRPVNVLMRLFGALRSYFIYLPNFKPKPHIKDYENDPELRARADPVWLRPGVDDGTYNDDLYRAQIIANSGEAVIDMSAPATVALETQSESAAFSDDSGSFSTEASDEHMIEMHECPTSSEADSDTMERVSNGTSVLDSVVSLDVHSSEDDGSCVVHVDSLGPGA